MTISEKLADALERLHGRKRSKKKRQGSISPAEEAALAATEQGDDPKAGTRTYVRKHNAAWAGEVVGKLMPLEVWVWRSVNVRFLRTFIKEKYAGKLLLRMLYWMEERFPHFLGKVGQYPLIVIRK